MRKAQADFSNLLTTSKALQPLIEKILWSSMIHLKVNRLIDGTFERAAMAFGVSERRHGEWTRELWLSMAQGTASMEACVWPIHALCPNLRKYSLYMDWMADCNIQHLNDILEGMGNTPAVLVDWASRITSFSMYSFPRDGSTWPNIHDISRWFPSLQTLIVEDYSWGWREEPRTTVATFPCLRHLSYNQERSLTSILHTINAPKLELLRIETPVDGKEREQTFKFLSRTKHTLVSLYLHYCPKTGHISFLDRVLETCTGLQILVLDFEWCPDFKSELVGFPTLRAPSVMPSLQRLILVVDGFLRVRKRGVTELTAFLQRRFSSDLFPHIKSVALEKQFAFEDSITKPLIETVEVTMPQAKVTWDYYIQAHITPDYAHHFGFHDNE
ncbi:hypothetical protein FRC14_007582 [Serendipita sp. 396]|nr:hypothetical protein FRC14_007582 [Serendipita sp. 396]KAG8777332.1 hypothetical protein FRC15_011395 [Serendipita sp. 397]KAG8793938.1 hypothetical protein FRC16_010777 [Serendipita sp. 398]KAG8856131.1 hypothetical protein FRB91_001190 [Serendipita sp. 411]KAG8861137.1 hypothetical protein FRC20_011494 [Serendipita sp. 405]